MVALAPETKTAAAGLAVKARQLGALVLSPWTETEQEIPAAWPAAGRHQLPGIEQRSVLAHDRIDQDPVCLDS